MFSCNLPPALLAEWHYHYQRHTLSYHYICTYLSAGFRSMKMILALGYRWWMWLATVTRGSVHSSLPGINGHWRLSKKYEGDPSPTTPKEKECQHFSWSSAKTQFCCCLPSNTFLAHTSVVSINNKHTLDVRNPSKTHMYMRLKMLYY